jgi:hypothetical protein
MHCFTVVKSCVYTTSSSVYRSTVAPRNANSLHAARHLLHRDLKNLLVDLIAFLSGLRARKALRRVAFCVKRYVPGKRVWLHFSATPSSLPLLKDSYVTAL